MTNFSQTHLDALNARHANEYARLNAATDKNEIATRKVWLAQYAKEIEAEKKFAGYVELPKMSDTELLAELGL